MDKLAMTGKVYRVRYLRETGNSRHYEMELAGVYLGPNRHKSTYDFSLRPLAGTTVIMKRDFLSAEEIPRGVKLPKVIRPLTKDEAFDLATGQGRN